MRARFRVVSTHYIRPQMQLYPSRRNAPNGPFDTGLRVCAAD